MREKGVAKRSANCLFSTTVVSLSCEQVVAVRIRQEAQIMVKLLTIIGLIPWAWLWTAVNEPNFRVQLVLLGTQFAAIISVLILRTMRKKNL